MLMMLVPVGLMARGGSGALEPEVLAESPALSPGRETASASPKPSVLPKPASAADSIQVAADGEVVDTGIDLTGDSLVLSANGFVKVGIADKEYGPDGDPNCQLGSDQAALPGLFPLGTNPCWSLIGRVGAGPWFFVGNSATIRAADHGTGRVFLWINDDHLEDNAGSWSVNITISTPTPARTQSPSATSTAPGITSPIAVTSSPTPTASPTPTPTMSPLASLACSYDGWTTFLTTYPNYSTWTPAFNSQSECVARFADGVCPQPAFMNSPRHNDVLAGSTVTFKWTAGCGNNRYDLWLGRTPGTADLFDAWDGFFTEITVSGLPQDGSRVYFRLGSWDSTDLSEHHNWIMTGSFRTSITTP